MSDINRIIIEDAKPGDWDEAMILAYKTFLKFEASEYGREGTDSFLRFLSDERLYKMFEAGLYKLAVAKAAGKIIGLASLRSGNHISLLFVDESYHRKNIGRSLIAYMQKNYLDSSRKQDGVKLTVNAAPYAVPFYRHIGFYETDTIQESEGITFIPMTLLYEL